MIRGVVIVIMMMGPEVPHEVVAEGVEGDVVEEVAVTMIMMIAAGEMIMAGPTVNLVAEEVVMMMIIVGVAGVVAVMGTMTDTTIIPAVAIVAEVEVGAEVGEVELGEVM